MLQRPSIKPARPFFSSGPCVKRPGWSVRHLEKAFLGRSHRATEGRARLREVIELSKQILEIPPDWRVGIVPASDTGAVEMILWALAGTRPIDVLSFESFSGLWAADLRDALNVSDLIIHAAPYGALPNLGDIDWSHDVVLTWNGTTSGVCIPQDYKIPPSREGLAICDATSAAFAMDLPWDNLDVVTWSWQKVLGGEAAHGMLALSPRAVTRLESAPRRALPKIFRLVDEKGLIEGIFRGDTINTPSMLCVEDARDSLEWAQSVGGLGGLKARVQRNLDVVTKWVDASDWIDFLAQTRATRSPTAICLKFTASWFSVLPLDHQKAAVKKLVMLLEQEGAGYDLAHYRDAPPGLRIWGGATVEDEDIAALLPWIEWGYAQVKAEFGA